MKVARVRDEYATKPRTAESMPSNDPHDTHSTANWKRAYPLSPETESHRKPVTPLHLSGRGVSGVDIAEKVLERLATSDRTTIVIERQPDGKIRVTSNSWGDEAKVFMRDQVLSWGDEAKVFMRDQVLELLVALPERCLHVARKTKRPDQWDPYVPPYDPHGPGCERNR
jgi:hypothetical protein